MEDVARVLVEPQREIADPILGRAVFQGPDALLIDVGGGVGFEQAQEIRGVGVAGVIGGANGLDELGLGALEGLETSADEAGLERFYTGGDDLAEQFEGETGFVAGPARLLVVADGHAPELAADNDGAAERGADTHVLEVLDMDRGDGTQERVAEVERGAGLWVRSRDDGDARCVDIADLTDTVAEVECSGLLGDVGGGVAEAEEGLLIGLAAFADDLPALVGVEPVDHGPVVARQGLEAFGGLIGQFLDGLGAAEAEGRLGDGLRWYFSNIRGSLDLDDGDVVGVAVGVRGELFTLDGDGQRGAGAHGGRAIEGGVADLADELGEGLAAEFVGRSVEPRADVLAALLDVGFVVEGEEDAEGLDGAQGMDRLPIAVGQIDRAVLRSRVGVAIGAERGHGPSSPGQDARSELGVEALKRESAPDRGARGYEVEWTIATRQQPSRVVARGRFLIG